MRERSERNVSLRNHGLRPSSFYVPLGEWVLLLFRRHDPRPDIKFIPFKGVDRRVFGRLGKDFPNLSAIFSVGVGDLFTLGAENRLGGNRGQRQKEKSSRESAPERVEYDETSARVPKQARYFWT